MGVCQLPLEILQAKDLVPCCASRAQNLSKARSKQHTRAGGEARIIRAGPANSLSITLDASSLVILNLVP